MLKSNRKHSLEINGIYKENRKELLTEKRQGHGLRCWARKQPRNWPKQWGFEVENGCTFRYGNLTHAFQ